MKLTGAYEYRIRERWDKIKPVLILHLKSGMMQNVPISFQTAMEECRRTHREAIILALELKIPFRHIRQYGMDDMRVSADVRAERRAQFLESRRRHPGRTPSLGRKDNRRPAAILPGEL